MLILCPILCLCVFFPLKEYFDLSQSRLATVFKALGSACALALALAGALEHGGSTWLCVAALGLCMAADVVLDLHFIAGMGVFFTGHALSIAWFLSRRPDPAIALIALVVLALCCVGFMRHWRERIGSRMLPFCLYAGILCVMGALGAGCGGWIALGALLFVLSDVMVCRVVIAPIHHAFDVTAMGIYYAALLLLGVGALLG